MLLAAFKQGASEAGFSVPAVLLSIAILSLATAGVQQRIHEYTVLQSEQSTIAGISALASASINWYTDSSDPSRYRVWPNDIATLKTAGFLSIFRNTNGVGNPYSLSTNDDGLLVIETQMNSVGAAKRVAAGYGSNALANDTTVTIAFSPPISIAVADENFLRRDGTNDMTGPLKMRVGAGNVVMNGNDLTGASRIESDVVRARNSQSTGLVEADFLVGDALVVRTFSYEQ